MFETFGQHTYMDITLSLFVYQRASSYLMNKSLSFAISVFVLYLAGKANMLGWNGFYWGWYSPIWQKSPTKGQNSFRAIELNRPFGFEIDLLNLQCRIPIIDSDRSSFSEWPFCFDIMKFWHDSEVLRGKTRLPVMAVMLSQIQKNRKKNIPNLTCL